jgi:hypothetical protein
MSAVASAEPTGPNLNSAAGTVGMRETHDLSLAFDAARTALATGPSLFDAVAPCLAEASARAFNALDAASAL